MPSRDKRRFAPFPEFVDPDPERGYTVHNISDVSAEGELGATDRKDRTMATPFTIGGAMVARQHLGRAKWSPLEEKRRNSKLLKACIRSVEDARVNSGLRRLKMPVVFPRSHSEKLQEEFAIQCEDEGITQLILRAVSGIGSNMEARYAKVLRKYHAEKPNSMVPWVTTILAQAHKKMKRAASDDLVFTHEQGVRIARWLAKNLEANDPRVEVNSSKAMKDLHNALASAVQQRPAYDGEPDPFDNRAWYTTYSRHGKVMPFDMKMGKFYGHDWEGANPPGEMSIDEPKRTFNVVPPKLEKIRKHTAADEGVEFRYIERFVTDQMVFRRKRKKREGGGSILIDVSGSMQIDEDDIEKMIKGAPEATLIAIYSGRGDKGQLRIIVAEGKRHFNVERWGGGNIVDVPALEWLSIQAPPRVWLSDGYATGIRDRSSNEIRAACRTICDDNFIKRCEGVSAVVEVLNRTDK